MPISAKTSRTAGQKDRAMVSTLKIAAFAALGALSVTLAGCGTVKPSREVTGSIPDDYRTRHPITIAEVRHTLDVPVASGDREMNVATRDAIRGFIQAYKATASSTVSVAYPDGALNSGAARHARKEIRAVLNEMGVSGNRIVETSYPANAANQSLPVQISYVAVTAMTNECGQWPEDLVSNTEDNRNWSNFGCASQQNLAAQIANPMDLVAPRAMSPIDAERRAEVIKVYREGT